MKDLLIPLSSRTPILMLTNEQAGILLKTLLCLTDDTQYPDEWTALLQSSPFSANLLQQLTDSISARRDHIHSVSEVRSEAARASRAKKSPSPPPAISPPVQAATGCLDPAPTDPPSLFPAPVPSSSAAGQPAPKRSTRFTKPTLQELQAHIDEKAQKQGITPSFNAEKFFSYYESCGWVVGKSRKPMKSWRATVTQWLIDEKTTASKPQLGREQISTKTFEEF